MSNQSISKPKLSKGILDMKFMQRTKAKVDKEIEVAEGRAMYSSELTSRMLNTNSNFIIEPSYVSCENLIEGRLSFRGMNPEIEREMELEKSEKEATTKRPEQEAEVSTNDMIEFYAAASHTIQRKFQKHKKVTNNKRSNSDNTKNKKNKKFKKPESDDIGDEILAK
uniref:M-phase phosphoprotein 6 n=1 Tax=Glossina palpalis gambiensis TaxID=67801 RepID=A0A1B0B7P0_9MUSC